MKLINMPYRHYAHLHTSDRDPYKMALVHYLQPHNHLAPYSAFRIYLRVFPLIVYYGDYLIEIVAAFDVVAVLVAVVDMIQCTLARSCPSLCGSMLLGRRDHLNPTHSLVDFAHG